MSWAKRAFCGACRGRGGRRRLDAPTSHCGAPLFVNVNPTEKYPMMENVPAMVGGFSGISFGSCTDAYRLNTFGVTVFHDTVSSFFFVVCSHAVFFWASDVCWGGQRA